MTEEEKARYESKLRIYELWLQHLFTYVHNSDVAAVNTGLGALKTIILVNAGAIVAILALVGQLWDGGWGYKIVSEILKASSPFMYGVITASISFMSAYFYQSGVTARSTTTAEDFSNNFLKSVDPSSEPISESPDVEWFIIIFKCLMIVLAIIGMACFVWGALEVSNVFQGWVKNGPY